MHKVYGCMLIVSAHLHTELLYKVGPRFGEICSFCCLPLLPQLACSILATWGPPYRGALYKVLVPALPSCPNEVTCMQHGI